MNYSKAYTDEPTPYGLGSVVLLHVVEAASSTPPRLVLRVGNGPCVSLEPAVARKLAEDLHAAATDVLDMRDEAEE